MKSLTLLLFLAALVMGCSKNGIPAEKKRPLSFYQPLINSSADYDHAADKLSELKVLTSTQKYDMRYALFDNGKVYYEVANLGKGTGEWKYRDGIVNVFASRSFFDLDIDLTALKAEGEDMEMQFVDRFGNNAVTVHLREPSAKPLRKLSMPANGAL